MKKRPKHIPSEIRIKEGELDEVVAGRCLAPKKGKYRPPNELFFHLERMDTGHVWMRLSFPDGGSIDVNLTTKKGTKIHARAERNL